MVSHVGSLHYCTAPILWHILHGDTVLDVLCKHFKLSPGIHRHCSWCSLLVVCTITQYPPCNTYSMGTLSLVFLHVSSLWCCLASMLQFILCWDTVLGVPCWQFAQSHNVHPQHIFHGDIVLGVSCEQFVVLHGIHAAIHTTWRHCCWCSMLAVCSITQRPPYNASYMGTLFLVFRVSGLWCRMASRLCCQYQQVRQK